MSCNIKYLVIAGYVGDVFMNGKLLILLYGVNPKECMIHNPNRSIRGNGYDTKYTILQPKSDGNYTLPKSEDELDDKIN